MQEGNAIAYASDSEELVIMSDKILFMNQLKSWENMQFVATTSSLYLYSVEQSRVKRAVKYDKIQGVSIGLMEQLKKHSNKMAVAE